MGGVGPETQPGWVHTPGKGLQQAVPRKEWSGTGLPQVSVAPYFALNMGPGKGQETKPLLRASHSLASAGASLPRVV